MLYVLISIKVGNVGHYVYKEHCCILYLSPFLL